MDRRVSIDVTLFILSATSFLACVCFLSGTGLAEISIDSPLEIDRDTVWVNEQVVAHAEIRVLDHGTLQLRGTEISFDGDYTFQAGIIVEPGGSLIVGRDGAQCLFHRGPKNESYFLRAFADTTVELGNLTIIGASSQTNLLSPWDWGACFSSDNMLVINCTIIDCFLGIGLEGASDSMIRGCVFRSCHRGILARQCDNVRVVNCTFIGDNTGIEYDGMGSTFVSSIVIEGCDFLQCRMGVGFNGWTQTISDCRFSSCYRAIFSNGGEWTGIRGIDINDSSVGMYLTSVLSAIVSSVNITSCDIGISLRDNSSLSISRGSIARCKAAIEVMRWNPEYVVSIEIFDFTIMDCEQGVKTSIRQQTSPSMGSVKMTRVEFDNVTSPLDADKFSGVTMGECAVRGSEGYLSFQDTRSVAFQGNVFAGKDLAISFDGIGMVSLLNDSFLVDTLDVTVNSTFLGTLDPLVLPDDSRIAENCSSTVMSTMPASRFQIAFLDPASQFIWFKWLSIRVVLLSTGGPAVGCVASIYDNHSDEGKSRTMGFGDEIDFGQSNVSVSNMTIERMLDPHTVRLTYRQIVDHQLISLLNESTEHVSMTLMLDDVPPAILIESPRDGAVLRSPEVVVRGQARDAPGDRLSMTMALDGSAQEEIPAVWNRTIGASPGWHRLRFTAIDAAGNVACAEVWFEILETAFSVTIERPSNGTITNLTTVTVEGWLIGSAWVTVNTVLIPVGDSGWFSTSVALKEGTNRIDLIYGGDEIEGNLTIVVERDTVPPVLTVREIPRIVRDATVDVVGTVSDAHLPSTIEVGGVGTPLGTSGEFSRSLSFEEGSHAIGVRVTDLAGNVASAAFTLRVDQRMELELVGQVSRQVKDEVFPISLRTEVGARIVIKVNGLVAVNGTFDKTCVTIPIELVDFGTHRIDIEGMDEAGNHANISMTLTRTAPSLGVRRNPYVTVIIIVIAASSVVVNSYIKLKQPKR